MKDEGKVMLVDSDPIVAAVLQWDFGWVEGGQTYRTRAPTLGELMAMGSSDTAAMGAAIRKLFVGEDKPKVETWSCDRLQLFATAIEQYTSDRSKKNRAIMVEKLRAPTP